MPFQKGVGSAVARGQFTVGGEGGNGTGDTFQDTLLEVPLIQNGLP